MTTWHPILALRSPASCASDPTLAKLPNGDSSLVTYVGSVSLTQTLPS